MKCIRVNEPGGPEKLVVAECEVPNHAPTEVVVQIKAIGVNYIDTIFRAGHSFLARLYGQQYPYIPGKEASGIVTVVGSKVKNVKPGQRVAFCSSMRGTYAEYACVPAREIVILPDDISFEIAAAALLQGLTAWYLANKAFKIKKNHFVLIHAGAGGVGTLLIQLAKLQGAVVIATASTDEKIKLLKELGVNYPINYAKTSFLEAVNKITHNAGVNVVYDSVGNATFDDSMKSLAIRGLLVSYGQTSGPIPPIDINRLAEKSSYLTQPALFHYTKTRRELSGMAEHLFKLIAQNKLKIIIGHKYELSEASKAHADLEGRKSIGKLILLP